MRVLVIGGGIGGMATSIALEQAGLDPYVLEQAPELTEIGSGIGMHANAMRVLTQLGAADHVRAQRRAHRHRRVAAHGRRAHDLHAALHGHGRALRRRVHLHAPRRPPREPRQAGSLRARAAEREARRARGAAGRRRGEARRTATRSSATSWSAPTACAPRSARSCSASRRRASPASRPGAGRSRWSGCPRASSTRIVTWPGRGRHAMTYPIRPDLQTFNGFVPTTEILREEWGPSGDLDDLRSSFEGATGDVLEIIDRITSALITPIFFRDPLPVWGTDRIILMGDAAHPTPPSAGQGAAQALEDSVTLAACLRRAGGPAGVPAALAEFAARRQARTASMLISARTNLAMFNEPDPIQQRARDGRLHRHAAHGPGRRVDVRLALRPRRDRRRRAAAAVGARDAAGHAAAGGAARVRAVGRRAGLRGPRAAVGRRARGLRALHGGDVPAPARRDGASRSPATASRRCA